MRGKLVYGGEWVRVANLRNKHFPAKSPCSICNYFTCGTVWFSYKTNEVRCLKCFTPKPVPGGSGLEWDEWPKEETDE